MSKSFFGGEFGDEDHYSANGRKPAESDYAQERPAPKAYASTQEIDVDKALADQFAEAESYRDHLLNNEKMYMPNHVTGAITSVNRIIDQIVKIRETVQNLARMQAFEAAVIQTMRGQSEEIRTEFFNLLEEKTKEIR